MARQPRAKEPARPAVKKLAREIGIITLGVLIALGIGELADFFRWQVRVQGSLAAIRLDLADASYTFLERRVIQPCIERQLKLLDVALEQARRTGEMPKVTGLMIYRARLFSTASWEVAKSEGVLLHMEREDAIQLGNIYTAIDTYPGDSSGAETENWRLLTSVDKLAGPIDSNLTSSLIIALRQAQAQWLLSGQIAMDQENAIRQFGVPILWPGFYPDGRHDVREIAAAMKSYGVCSP